MFAPSLELEVSAETATPVAEPQKKTGPWRWIKWVLISILAFIVLLFALVIGGLLHYNVPSNSAGLAAQTVCSGTFTSGRDADTVFTEDVLPQSPALSVVSTSVDESGHSVTAKFLGMFERRASLVTNRGCVLDLEPDPTSPVFSPPAENPAAWPTGQAATPQAQWPTGVNKAGLQKVIDNAFIGAGDPNAANARGLAVVYKGKLLAERNAAGFPQGTPLLGWSMTKTVNGMLFYKRAHETGFDINQKVVDAFPSDREPAWVESWRSDAQKQNITVADILFMRSGLDMEDDYGPQGKVVQMLYGEPSMPGFAAVQPMLADPGTQWAYSTGGADILSEITQGMFKSDQAYWEYTQAQLFKPLGIDQGTVATDTAGTWVGGSYLYASTADWARVGQLMLADGMWGNQKVLPAGWWQLAATPAMPTGEGNGYGAQTWIPGQPENGECAAYPGVPKDALSMDGHYGQIVAMVPSQDAVIVRLGWTIDKTQFDGCQLISDVLANLPK